MSTTAEALEAMEKLPALRADLATAAGVVTALEVELAEVRAGRDALEASDECGVDGIPPCSGPGTTEADWCRMCLVSQFRRLTTEAASREAEYSTALAFAQTELAALVAECDGLRAKHGDGCQCFVCALRDVLERAIDGMHALQQAEAAESALATERAAHAKRSDVTRQWHNERDARIAAESREAALRALLPRLIQAARDGYGHAGKAGCAGCDAVAEGVAALAAVPAPDAAPTEAALMAVAEQVREGIAETFEDERSPFYSLEHARKVRRIDLAAIIKERKP